MKIIVGLGNPGREYASTRHNVGFLVVDELARRFAMTEKRTRFRGEIVEAFADGSKIALLKPQTYMNLSGVSVLEATRWYKTPLADLMIVADDIDLPFATIRMRAKGGSGGHNGLKSIFEQLGSQEIPRLRIGVGRGASNATRQVLSRFTPEEVQHLPEVVTAAADCVLDWERHGIIQAMNRCNRVVGAPALDSVGAKDVPASDSKPSTAATAIGDRGRTSSPGTYNRLRAWLRRHAHDPGGSADDRPV